MSPADTIAVIIPSGGSITAYAVCSTTVEFQNEEKSVSYLAGCKISHLLDQCVSSFLLPHESVRRLQILDSTGKVMEMTDVIPFHGFKERLTLRYATDKGNAVLPALPPPKKDTKDTITIRVSYNSPGDRVISLSVKNTDLIRSVLQQYLRVLSIWRFQQ